MQTLHERALIEVVCNAMRISEWRGTLGSVASAARSGEYPQWFVDFVCQRARGSFDSLDAYVLGSILARYRRGELLFTKIQLGSTPLADREREANQALLRALPAPFTALVEPDADGDGLLMWSKESVALEIGTTASSRTLMHLEFRQGLARWPYGSDSIILARKTHKWVHWSSGLWGAKG